MQSVQEEFKDTYSHDSEPLSQIAKKLITHQVTTPEQILYVAKNTVAFRSFLHLNPIAPSEALEEILRDDEVSYPNRLNALRHPNLTAQAAADYLTLHPTSVVHQIFRKRKNWKEILLIKMKPIYPEITDQLPLEWLEELYFASNKTVEN